MRLGIYAQYPWQYGQKDKTQCLLSQSVLDELVAEGQGLHAQCGGGRLVAARVAQRVSVQLLLDVVYRRLKTAGGQPLVRLGAADLGNSGDNSEDTIT